MFKVFLKLLSTFKVRVRILIISIFFLEQPIISRLTDRRSWKILTDVSSLHTTLAGGAVCPRRVCSSSACLRISALAPSCLAEVPPEAPVHSHCKGGVKQRGSKKIAEIKGSAAISAVPTPCPRAGGVTARSSQVPREELCSQSSASAVSLLRGWRTNATTASAQGPAQRAHVLLKVAKPTVTMRDGKIWDRANPP